MTADADSRPRLAGDLAGAFGDLGTFLPLVLGALAVAGLPPAGVLGGFGLAYGLTAVVFRAPVPVQPMKVAAAVLVTTAPDAETVVAAGLVLGAFFLVAGATGVIERLAEWVPDTVTAGLQIGLGGALAWLALTRIAESPGFGAALLAITAALLLLRPAWPVAVMVLAGGIAGGAALGLVPTGPLPVPRPAIPTGFWPDARALLEGTLTIALPQIPLTLTNAILVTAAIGRERFPRARRLDETTLSLTTGAINLVTAPFGAMPMCHGAGGVAAHHRFGARTGRAPAILAVALLALGLIWGDAATALFGRVPSTLLGVLLLVPAIDLIRAARPTRWSGRDRGLIAAIAALALWSPAVAFIIGAAGAIALKRWTSRPAA